MRKRVYIAGPMTRGDRIENLSQALKAMRTLMRHGYAPFCPQLTFFCEPFMESIHTGQWPAYHSDWMAIDLPWVAVADAVLRLPGPSEGADREVEAARTLGIPVFADILDLFEALPVTEETVCQHPAPVTSL